jgi:hypothetical protein
MSVSMIVYTDEKLVESLYQLLAALQDWQFYAATKSCEETSPEEIAGRVLEHLTAAASRAGKEASV